MSMDGNSIGPHAQLTDVKRPSGSGNEQEKPPPPPTETDFFLNPAIYDASAFILHEPRNDVDAVSALFTAAKEGHEEAVAALLRSKRTDINVLNRKGVSPLSIAAQRGNPSIVDMLIKNGAKVDVGGYNGATALIQASHFGYAGIVKLLLRANADVDRRNLKGTTAIMRASQEGREEVVRILAETGADINRRNNERMNALMLASQRGHSNIVRYLLQQKAEVDGTTSQGSSALMLACKRKHIDVVEALLVAGADMHIRDRRNRTARETAEKKEYSSIVELLNNQSQMFLMRSAARSHRALQLHFVYKLALGYGVRRKTSLQVSVPDPFPGQLIADSSMEKSSSIQILRQTFRLPWHVYDRIVSFIPHPRLWQSTLKRLRMQRHGSSDEAFRAVLEIIDEILNDALQIPPPDPPLYLIAVATRRDLQSFLVDEMKMPPHLLKLLIEWSDAQSICSRLSNIDVTYLLPAAEKILKLADELSRWYDAVERGILYSFDTVTMMEPIHSVDEESHSSSNVEMQHDADSGSSDGEMDV